MSVISKEVRNISWTGVSGIKYSYKIYPIGTNFKDVAGNYIYSKETSPGSWAPVYIGQTNSLKNRLAQHEKEHCAVKNGATHIHVHTSSNKGARLKEEKDLIVKWKPLCNEQLAN